MTENNDVRPLPTQARHPWNAVARTILATLAMVPYVLPLLPDIINASGLAQTAFGAGALVIVGAVTRILAIPGVNAWFRDHLPLLAAQGKR